MASACSPRYEINTRPYNPGSLVRQLTTADAAMDDAACVADTDANADADAGADAGPGRRVRHVVFLASGRSAAETLERAVCSIAFKSHLAMPPRPLA
jgi:hypothetical protein|tara:strand:- start:238 stop:528 length:291 start_codon:yes stop_codon:yes gene_type:complete